MLFGLIQTDFDHTKARARETLVAMERRDASRGDLRQRQSDEVDAMRRRPYSSDTELALIAEVHRREAEVIAYAELEAQSAQDGSEHLR